MIEGELTNLFHFRPTYQVKLFTDVYQYFIYPAVVIINLNKKIRCHAQVQYIDNSIHNILHTMIYFKIYDLETKDHFLKNYY